jgi:hypothetical protein
MRPQRRRLQDLTTILFTQVALIFVASRAGVSPDTASAAILPRNTVDPHAVALWRMIVSENRLPLFAIMR